MRKYTLAHRNKDWTVESNQDRLKDLYLCIAMDYADDTATRNWLLRFYKDVPRWFHLQSYEDYRSKYPDASTWKEVDNYM